MIVCIFYIICFAGPVVQSTIVEGVKSLVKSFTQHWVNVEDLKVLMLDFGGAFTLFVPNMEGNFFNVCTTEVEVQVKPTSDGTNLTYMKFVFQSPILEIVAPVLEDRNLGYRVLKQNTACVFLGQVFPCSSKPQQQQQRILEHQLIPHPPQADSMPLSPQTSMVQNSSQQHLSLSQQNAILMSPDVSLQQPSNNQRRPQQLILPNQQIATITAQEHPNNNPSELYYSQHGNNNRFNDGIVVMPGAAQPQNQISSNDQIPANIHTSLTQPVQSTPPTQQQQSAYQQSHLYHQQQTTNAGYAVQRIPGEAGHGVAAATNSSVSSINIGTHHSSPVQQDGMLPQPAMQFQQHEAPQLPSPSKPQNLQLQLRNDGPVSQHKLLSQIPESKSVDQQHSKQTSLPPRISLVKEGKFLFPEEMKETLYPLLKPKELEKVIRCNKCSRKFNFLSEHLVHLEMHTQNVESTVEMSVNVWVQDRRLKCELCKKFKTSYTLQYARHRDNHIVEGLACKKCMMELNTPHEYAQHLKIHHPKKIFSEPQSETASEPAPLEQPVVADNSSYGLEKTGAAALQDNNEEHCEDTDVIEANIGKEIGDEEMLESIFNADVSEQKGILDDSHEHEDEVCNKNKDVEHSSMPILTAGEEKLKAERTKSVDSLGNEDLLNAIQKCDDQNFIQNAMHDGNDVQMCLEDSHSTERSDLRQAKKDPPMMEDEESVNDSVMSLVKDLSGRIAEQSFGFDKDEVGPTSDDYKHQKVSNALTRHPDSRSNPNYKDIRTSVPVGQIDKESKSPIAFESRESSHTKSQSSNPCSSPRVVGRNESTRHRLSESSHSDDHMLCLSQNKPGIEKKSKVDRLKPISNQKSYKTDTNQHVQHQKEVLLNTTEKKEGLRIQERLGCVNNSSKAAHKTSPERSHATAKLEKYPKPTIESEPASIEKHSLENQSKPKKYKDKNRQATEDGPVYKEKYVSKRPKDMSIHKVSNYESNSVKDTEEFVRLNKKKCGKEEIQISVAKAGSKSVISNANPAQCDEPINQNSDFGEEDLNLQLELSEDEEAKEVEKEMEIDNSNKDNTSSPKASPLQDQPENLGSPTEHRCSSCGDKFVTMTSLKIHKSKCGKDSKLSLGVDFEQPISEQVARSPCISISSSTSDDDTASEDTSLKCEYCHDQFRSLNSFKMHQRLCKKKNKDDVNIKNRRNNMHLDGPKRQYVIPEDLPDQPSTVVQNRFPAYTSDDEDDNAEGIWKRKSMAARERRKSWLKSKNQKMAKESNNSASLKRGNNDLTLNKRKYTSLTPIKNRLISNIKASPSSSSVPCSSAASGESSYSSSEDDDSVSIPIKSNLKKSSLDVPAHRDNTRPIIRALPKKDGEKDEENYRSHDSLLSAHFNNKSVQKQIDKLQVCSSNKIEPNSLTTTSDLDSPRYVSTQSSKLSAAPKGLKLKIKVGGDRGATVLYVPPKRGRGRPRGSRNGKGGGRTLVESSTRNKISSPTMKTFNHNISSNTNAGIKPAQSKSILFPSIPHQGNIPLPKLTDSEMEELNSPEKSCPSISENSTKESSTHVRFPINRLESFENNRIVPKIVLKVPNTKILRMAPQKIKLSNKAVLRDNTENVFPPSGQSFKERNADEQGENPTDDSVNDTSQSKVQDLSEISDSLTEISENDDLEYDARKSPTNVSKSTKISEKTSNEPEYGDNISDQFTNFNKIHDIRKQVAISGCDPTEWRMNKSRNCESVEENNLLTQLECLSSSVRLTSLNVKDVRSTLQENYNDEYAAEQSEAAQKVWLYPNDIETLKDGKEKNDYHGQPNRADESFMKFDRKSILNSNATIMSEENQTSGIPLAVPSSKKSVPPLRIRLSSISGSIEKNQPFGFHDVERKCIEDGKGLGKKLSDVLSNFVVPNSPQSRSPREEGILVENMNYESSEDATINDGDEEEEEYSISGNIKNALELVVALSSVDDTVSNVIQKIIWDAVSRCDCDTPIWMKSSTIVGNIDGLDCASEVIDPLACPPISSSILELRQDEPSIGSEKHEEPISHSKASWTGIKDYDTTPEESELDENDGASYGEFQVIRIPSSPRRKTVNRRKQAGLSGSDYKKRKRNKPRKLDKLIIKNISKLMPSRKLQSSPITEAKKQSSVFEESSSTFDTNEKQDSEKICRALVNGMIDSIIGQKVKNELKVPPLIIRPDKRYKEQRRDAESTNEKSSNIPMVNSRRAIGEETSFDMSNNDCSKVDHSRSLPPLKINIKNLLNRKTSMRLGTKRSLAEIKDPSTSEGLAAHKKSKHKSRHESSATASITNSKNLDTQITALETSSGQEPKSLVTSSAQNKTVLASLANIQQISSEEKITHLNHGLSLKSYRSNHTPSLKEENRSPTPNGSKSHSALLTSARPRPTRRKETWILGTQSSLGSSRKCSNKVATISIKEAGACRDKIDTADLSNKSRCTCTRKKSTPDDFDEVLIDDVLDRTGEEPAEKPTEKRVKPDDFDEVLIDSVLDSFNESDLANELSPTEDESVAESIQTIPCSPLSTDNTVFNRPYSDTNIELQRKSPVLVLFFKEDKIERIKDIFANSFSKEMENSSSLFPMIKYPGQLTRGQHRHYMNLLRKRQVMRELKIDCTKIDNLLRITDYQSKENRWRVRNEQSITRSLKGSDVSTDSLVTASAVLNDMLSKVVAICEQEKYEAGNLLTKINAKKKRSSPSGFSRNGYVKRRRRNRDTFSRVNSKIQPIVKTFSASTKEAKENIHTLAVSAKVTTLEAAAAESHESDEVVKPLVDEIFGVAISKIQRNGKGEDMWSSIIATAKSQLKENIDDSGSLILSSELDDDMNDKRDPIEDCNEPDDSFFVPKVNNNQTIIIRRGLGETTLLNAECIEDSGAVLPYKCLSYQYDYGSSLGDDESMSSDALCNNETSQDEEEHLNNARRNTNQIKTKLSTIQNRQKSNRSPFSSSGYVRRRRRRKLNKKLGVSGLANDPSNGFPEDPDEHNTVSTISEQTHVQEKSIIENSNVANRQTTTAPRLHNNHLLNIPKKYEQRLGHNSSPTNITSDCTKSIVSEDHPVNDRSGLAQKTSDTAPPRLVQRNFYVMDEFESEVTNLPCKVDEEKSTDPAGRPKRKRFQNVRMLPIGETTVSSKANSTPGKSSNVPSQSNEVPKKSSIALDAIARPESDIDVTDGKNSKKAKPTPAKLSDVENQYDQATTKKAIGLHTVSHIKPDNDATKTRDSKSSIKKEEPKLFRDVTSNNESDKSKLHNVTSNDEFNKSKCGNDKRNRSRVKITNPKRKAVQKMRRNNRILPKTRKVNKCDLTIEDELRIIKKTMVNGTISSVKKVKEGSSDKGKSITYRERDSMAVSQPSTTVLPPRKRKIISTLENGQELITETIRTRQNEDQHEYMISTNILPLVNSVRSASSHRDFLTRKTTAGKNIVEPSDAKDLLYKKVISQKAKEVIEKSSILKQRKTRGLMGDTFDTINNDNSGS